MSHKVNIIDLEEGRKIQRFESWNADSFYFHDASGNLAEFIVRHDLKNDSNSDFVESHILGVNEIGLPTCDIVKTNHMLQEGLGSQFWKGDESRFGTNGSQEGLFLLPNYTVKETWFPTTMKIIPEPFEVEVESKGRTNRLIFQEEEIAISLLF